MLNTLKMTLKIDCFYAVNSFIYALKKLPIFKDLFTDDIYKSKFLKRIIGGIGLFLSFSRALLYKLLYFYVLYFISSIVADNKIDMGFVHVYIIFSIIGLFINNKLLVADSKKYYSIVLFNMDSKKYMKTILWFNIFISFLFNSCILLVFSKYIGYSIILGLLLAIFNAFCRIIGEGINIWFYRTNNYLWHSNTKLYFSILILLLVFASSPIFNIFISGKLLVVLFFLFFIFSICSLVYLYKLSDYKLIFKRINTKAKVMSSDQEKDYSRQAMVMVRDKDKVINSKKIMGKKGYDLFNTIFFERHREILYRSSMRYTAVISILVLGISLLIVNYNVGEYVLNFLYFHLAWFVIIMYFINRGAIVTQAMFYNCDHAMLTYNFYREPKVLLNLFKKRLITVIKINLVPALVLAIGMGILLFLSGATLNINYITIPVFIIILSVFFSVHYLAIYYLLQPYNKDMQVKKASYSLISILVYFISYSIKDVVMSSVMFSIFGILFTLVYIIVSLFLVYKIAPKTFKLN